MVTPVLSGSMRPGFAVGGLVVCERAPVDSVQVRDVIVFRRPDLPSEQVIHRVVSIKTGLDGGREIQTQGDANQSRDPWTLTISGSHVYRARWSIPLLGYVAVAFQNHRPLVLVGAGVVVLLVAASSLVEDRRRRRRRLAGTRPEDTDAAAG